MDHDGRPSLKLRYTARTAPRARSGSSSGSRSACRSAPCWRSSREPLTGSGWQRHVGPASGSDAKVEKSALRHVLTTFTCGSRLGPAQAARHMREVSAHELGATFMLHYRVEKIDRGIADVINAYLGSTSPRGGARRGRWRRRGCKWTRPGYTSSWFSGAHRAPGRHHHAAWDLDRSDRRREVGPRTHPIPDHIEVVPQIGLEASRSCPSTPGAPLLALTCHYASHINRLARRTAWETPIRNPPPARRLRRRELKPFAWGSACV
jgi:hypothetical protein